MADDLIQLLPTLSREALSRLEGDQCDSLQ